jgi:hypothetical protein
MKTFRFFFLAAAAVATAVIGAPGCSSDDSSGGTPDSGADVKTDTKKEAAPPITCEAHQISDYAAPTNLHKTVKQNVCEDGWTDEFYAACFDEDSTQEGCTAWTDAHPDCTACIVTPNASQATWGALYVMDGQLYINVIGCVAAAGGEAGATCEKNSQIWEDCAGKVCSEEWCPDTTDPDFQTCLDDAANGTCKTWAEPYNTCVTDAQTNSATSFCFKAGGSNGDPNALKQIFRTICGGAPLAEVDAGTEAGTDEDSGTN